MKTGPSDNSAASRPGRDLPEAAQRALAEAEARRQSSIATALSGGRETGGRDGPDPVRYGNWEYRGRAIDF